MKNVTIEEIENRFLSQYLDPEEKSMLRCYFNSEFDKETFIKLVMKLNPEDKRNYLMLAAQICYEKDCWPFVDNRYRKQIQGVYRFNQISNTIQLKVLQNILQAFNKEMIQVLLIKGSAMRVHFDKNKARLMSDIDLVVLEKDFESAKNVLVSMGAVFKGISRHSETYILDKVGIDLHHQIFKYREENGSDIWKQTRPITVYNSQAWVLSDLDMLIHLFVTQTYCFLVDEHPKRHIKWLYDSYVVLKTLEQKDLVQLPQRIKELHCSNSFYFTYRLFIDCFPEIKDKISNIAPDEDYKKWLIGNYKFKEITRQFNEERHKYDVATFSLKTIFLQLKYMIPIRNYIYMKLNTKDGERINFIRFIREYYGFGNKAAFKSRVLNRFRLKEVKK